MAPVLGSTRPCTGLSPRKTALKVPVEARSAAGRIAAAAKRHSAVVLIRILCHYRQLGVKQMRPILLLSATCLGLVWTAQAADVPEIPFDSSVDFLKLPSEMHFGETSGVAVNSKKHIFVFNRGNTSGPA